FFLPKDRVLPSFLMQLSPPRPGLPGPTEEVREPASPHRIYDWMFEDIRAKLNVKSGDPIKPEHLE
ncbi:DUF5064 family protein, partial [Rhodococcus hoagii]|nr:DUF5064 family protein [Prescottella equi]